MFNIIDYISSFKKLFSKKDIFFIFFIFILFFVTRLVNLDQFPIFCDEGIYIHWSKVAWKDASWRFISLTDGRQPLHTWGIIPFLKLFEHNALFAGRLFSVFGGFAALIGIVVTGWYLLGKRVGMISGLLYTLTPYFLFYDRMALIDSGVNAFTIWIFLFSIILARTLRLDIALILGLISGLALLTKSSVKLYLGFAFFAMIFVTSYQKKLSISGISDWIKENFFEKSNKIKEIASFIFLYTISVFLAVVIYNIQRLSPFFHFVSEKNKTFILTFDELLKNPFDIFSHNIVNIPYYIFSETGAIVFLLSIIGIYFLYKRHRILCIYFLIWLIGGLILISFVAKVLYPRYVLSLGGLMIIPAAYLLSLISNKKRFAAVIGVFLVSVIYFNHTIIFDYKNIPFPKIDRGQYLEDWPAGWGIKEIMLFARDKSYEKPVILLAEGGFGMSGDTLDVYLQPDDKISIKSYWPLDLQHLQENISLVGENHVYIVFARRSEFPPDWPIKLVAEYPKARNKASIYLFELIKK